MPTPTMYTFSIVASMCSKVEGGGRGSVAFEIRLALLGKGSHAFGHVVGTLVIAQLQQFLAQGIGTRLMELAMEGSGYRAVCINSIQPISTALYARDGMVPLVPIYIFLGAPQRNLPPLPAGILLRPMAADEVAPLDR